MSRASEAYARLAGAMETIEPDCLGSDLFTADDLSNADKAACEAVCGICPLFALCREYADIERPKAGIWAGKRYRNYKSKGTE